jgi:RNA polymerase sigma-70 factor, ECF subfamily
MNVAISAGRYRYVPATAASTSGRRASARGLMAYSEEELRSKMSAVATGDRQSFAELFAYFAPKVKSLLMRKGYDAALAEEIAQEVMLAVWRKAGLYDAARANPTTWIFSIVRNRTIDRFRNERRHTLIAPDPSDEVEGPPDGEAVLVTSDEEREVRAALSRLSEEQALIIRSFYFDDKSHSQIATDLSLPLGTVKSRVRLAIAHLRKLLDDRE